MLEIISLSMKSSIMMQERPEGGRSMTELLRSRAHDSQGQIRRLKKGEIAGQVYFVNRAFGLAA
jgi:hypothetical protein